MAVAEELIPLGEQDAAETERLSWADGLVGWGTMAANVQVASAHSSICVLPQHFADPVDR